MNFTNAALMWTFFQKWQSPFLCFWAYSTFKQQTLNDGFPSWTNTHKLANRHLDNHTHLWLEG